MEKLSLSVENDGFYGTYYENPKKSDCVVIGLFGDERLSDALAEWIK